MTCDDRLDCTIRLTRQCSPQKRSTATPTGVDVHWQRATHLLLPPMPPTACSETEAGEPTCIRRRPSTDGRRRMTSHRPASAHPARSHNTPESHHPGPTTERPVSWSPAPPLPDEMAVQPGHRREDADDPVAYRPTGLHSSFTPEVTAGLRADTDCDQHPRTVQGPASAMTPAVGEGPPSRGGVRHRRRAPPAAGRQLRTGPGREGA